MSEQITVLGKTFNSEGERREHFRKELRKKLPELKKMEGFPIGEDDDIINLSDPPYYTACPNPWLSDFVAEWEQEKKEIEREGRRTHDLDVSVPFTADISEGKKNPVYNAHTYITKVPHPAIMRFLLHYTQPGDIVYDGFAGSGMTGVAAQCCSNPEIATKIKLKSNNWGGRKVILNDLSTISGFISNGFNRPTNLDKFVAKATEIQKKIEDDYGWMYETFHTDGRAGRINYTVWSDIYACKNCSGEMVFWDVAIDHFNNVALDEFTCKSCGTRNSKKDLSRVWTTELDSVTNESLKKVKKAPVLIHYKVGSSGYTKKPDEHDFKVLEKVRNMAPKHWVPTSDVPRGDKTGEPLSLGINKAHQFFTDRTLICLSAVKDLCDSETLIVLTSMLNRSSLLVKTLVSNYLAQQRGKTIGGWAGTPLDGTLFIPSINSEVSVLSSLGSRTQSLGKMVGYTSRFNKYGNYSGQVGSATGICLESNSVDYIFIDPPFGSNRIYSDLNFINESWIGVLTNNTDEAIESRSQGKSLLDYHGLMYKCFKEFHRVLKPGKWMTVEFSNTSAAVWNGIQTALSGSGFVVANVSALDKKQGSFNAVNNPTSVKQDLIISCYKPSSEFDETFRQKQHTELAVWDFVEEHLNHLPIHLMDGNSTTAIIERSPKILFDRLIAFYVQKGLPVPIDAGKFQKGLRERFVGRDGMFFTQEQVQIYDKKKAEAPEFVQLSLLVSSEQDGVLWLKNVLKEKSMKYQDINPEWMQALAGVRKGDVLPELAVLLEENFLEKEGKWYVPDPENEIDLEQLRTKRLLKQFYEYCTQASKPKGKIKEARVDALRAGFKHCYQDKDFKTIVQVGDRIPNNLLMEDEVLLQFYDIASSRV